MSKGHLEYFIWIPVQYAIPEQPFSIHCGISLRIYPSHRELSLMLNYHSMLVIDESVCDFGVFHENCDQIIDEIKRAQDSLLKTAHALHFHDLMEPYHEAVNEICTQIHHLLRLIDDFQLESVPR